MSCVWLQVLTMTPGSDGLPFHGHSAGTFDGAAYYAYSNGRMRCGMVVCQFYLTDVGDDDGGDALEAVHSFSSGFVLLCACRARR